MRKRTRAVIPEITDYYNTIISFGNNKLRYFTFNPKSGKPMKTVIRQLLSDTPAEDTSNGL
jgi:hypothetical protein